jgi:transcriptional regulator with XRE-family HTH domain
MRSLLTLSKAQDQIRKDIKAIRLNQGLTQEGLSVRAGVPLPTLRKFEQKGLISLEAFLKILVVLGRLESIVAALQSNEEHFESIDDVLKRNPKKPRRHGWRT